MAGTNEIQARYIPGHDKHCPSFYNAIETCGHELLCEEEGRVDVLHRSINLLERWLDENDANEKLQEVSIAWHESTGASAAPRQRVREFSTVNG